MRGLYTGCRFIITLILLFSVSSVHAFQDSDINIRLDRKINVTCPGTSTGRIEVSISGLTSSHNISWTGPGNYTSTSEDLFNIPVGTYTIIVTDSTFQTLDTASFTINQNDPEDPRVESPANISGVTDPGECTASSIDLVLPEANDNCEVESITHNAPSVFPLGSTTVTWTITDTSGNTTQTTNTVTISDNQDPTITAPANKTVNTSPGSCTATSVSLGEPTTNDNCSVKSISNNAPTAFPLGETIVVWTVSDHYGNNATASQIITVKDNESPSLSIPGNLNIAVDENGCTATGVQLGTATASDNCGTPTITNNAPTAFPLGTTEVTWTATDAAQNKTSRIQTVTVTDETDPKISAPATVRIGTDNNSCEATQVGLGNPTFSDNCGQVSFSNNAPNSFSLGTTTVTWTARDEAGNTATATQTVIVEDKIRPSITAPAPVNVSTDSNVCTATRINLGTPAIDDNCQVKSVTNNAPDEFPTGTTIVTWTVTDAAGNTRTATQNVTVEDTQKPTISVPADLNIFTNSSSCTATGVDLGNVQASDNCEVTYFENDAPSTFPLGTTTVTWTARDAAGNITRATQKVNVTDNTAPKITAPAAVSVNTDSGSCYATGVHLSSPTTSDNCAVKSVNNNAPASFPIGTTTVTWTVTDEAGNTTTANQEVKVTDAEDPKISISGNITVAADSGKCSASNVNLGTPQVSDNCEVASWRNNAPTSFLIGTTTVTWTVTDKAGNTVNTTQKVLVEDREAPKISAPATINTSTDSGKCTATVSLGTPQSSDNCSGATVTHNAPSVFPIGTTEVTWTITDAAGNTTSDIQRVTVSDNEKPKITAPAAITRSTNANSCLASGFSLGTPTTSDNCGSVNVTHNAPGNFPLGSTTVTWTVKDAAGNTSTATQIITIKDTQVPVITKPADITVGNDSSTCKASLTINAPGVSDNCSVGNPTATRSDGKTLTAAFPVGTTKITWNTTDANGNKAVAVVQTVTVKDEEAPVAPNLQDVIWGCEYTLSTPYATDNCSGRVRGTTTDPLTYSTPGTHPVTWTFTDASGNTSQATQNVIIDPVKASADISHVLCNGYSTGSVTVSGSGGIGPYTYSWNGLGTGATKNNLPAGTYQVTVTDSKGCRAETLEVVITQPDTFIEIKPISYTVGCFGQNNATATAEVTGGTGSYTYEWDNGQTTKTATGLAPGQHTLKITDENGCVATRSVTIEAPQELVISSFSTTETTNFDTPTGKAIANVSGGTAPYSFRWSDGQTGQIARNLRAGQYSVTITDANGCTVTDTVTIIDPLESAIVPTSLCLSDEGGLRTSTFETEFIRGGTAPYDVHWTFGSDAMPRTATGRGTHVVDYEAKGNKTIVLTVTDAMGLTYTETFHHYVGECFEACGQTGNIDLDLETFYVGKENGDPLTANECGNYTGKKYIYLRVTQNANAYNPTVEFIYTVTNLTTGAIVDVGEVTGCVEIGGTGNEAGKIPEKFRVAEIQNWACGYSIQLENFYMSWTNNHKKKCGDVRNMMCISTNEQDEIIFPLFASAEDTDLLCYGAGTGAITVKAAGGAGAYEYRLETASGSLVKDWQASNTFTDLPAGRYIVKVSDSSDDVFVTPEVSISEPSNPLEITKPVVKTEITCYSGNNGSATVEVIGGTPFTNGNPYIYVWSNGQTTPTATGLSAGSYTVTIIDANGCELTETILIEQPEYIPSHAGEDIVLSCGINFTRIGEHIDEDVTGSWSYINGPDGWTLEDPTSPVTTFTGNIGTYTLRWTTSCGSTDDVRITIGDCNTIDFDGTDDHIDFGNTYNLTGDFTLEAWVKPINLTGSRTVLSKRNHADYAASGYDLLLQDGIPEFRWNGGSVVSSHPIDSDRWYHLAVIANSDSTSIFVDGIHTGSSKAASPAGNTVPFIIGALYDGSQPLTSRANFHGWIEEVRIWNTGLNLGQLRFMMNQHLENNGGMVKGKEIPFNVPGNLPWNELTGYYHMEIIENGYTLGQTPGSVKGKLRNITTVQQRSAPLPYLTKRNGNWNNMATSTTPWMYGEGVWDAPNSRGVTQDSINWNIVRTSHNITSGRQDLVLLGLFSDSGRLNITDASKAQNEYNPGHSLRITDYLALDGVLDLVGESQLLQDEGSILEEASSGYLERDQQGRKSSYNYNYWTSPVSTKGQANNSGFTVKSVLWDGSNPTAPAPIDFNYQYHYADWSYSGLKRISSYWLFTFTNFTTGTYSNWNHIRETGHVKPAEGFSMKGTTGSATLDEKQNYVFIGKPNNGDISLPLDAGNDYLVGNPYPSALDSHEFIEDNIRESGGNNSKNIFNGTLYFWDHFGGKSHYLQDYVGGYATVNLSGELEAVSTDTRINANGQRSTEKPGRYIPVGQAFYVSTKLAPELVDFTSVEGGDILFRNDQRVFETDDQSGDQANFKSKEDKKGSKAVADTRQKIYLSFKSPEGYNRQLLVTRDENTSTGFDLGYDAPLIENNKEDMYWMISDVRFVIQGVPDFDLTRVLPLGVRTKADGAIRIGIDRLLNIPDEMNLYLKDNQANEIHDLRAGSYKGIATGGSVEDRFSIIFHKDEEQPEGETGEENPTEEEGEETEEETDEENGEENSGEETPPVPGPEATLPQEELLENIQLSFSNRESEIRIKNPFRLEIQQGVLYNALGQKLKEFNKISSEAASEVAIDRRPSGVYIFKLRVMEGQEKSLRFILE